MHVLLSGAALPSQFPADDQYPIRSERSRVRELARSRYPHGIAATSIELSDAPGIGDPLPKIVFGARCAHGRLFAEADIWRQAKDGSREAVLVREGTSIKDSYFREAAILDYCFTRCESEPARILIAHVNKSVERAGQIEPLQFLIERDVTRRVRAVRKEITRDLDAFLDELDADPLLSRHADRLCRGSRTCPLCSRDVDPPESSHIESLHRGGSLVAELRREGFTSIADVPPDRLHHPRQRIQQRSLIEDRPQIDVAALKTFVDALEYPRFYLDFEATSTALPPFDRVRAWEHVPYLYSLHRDDGDGLSHTEFIVTPGIDGREQMVQRLVDELGPEGSIIVYSAGFERGIISRLAEIVPDHGDALAGALERIVDLLQPFADFSFYHHEQGGKVSLKTVLPVLTNEDYSEERIQDGYTANLAYRYLSELATSGQAADDQDTILSDLASYCEMDTMAMVHIVSRLEHLVG